MKPQKNFEVQRLPKAEDVCLTSVNKGKYVTSLECYVNRKYMEGDVAEFFDDKATLKYEIEYNQ